MSTGAGVSAATNIVGGEIQGWAALLDKWAMQKKFQQEAAAQAAYRQQGLNVLEDHHDPLYGTPLGIREGVSGAMLPGAISQSSAGAMQRGVAEGAAMRNQAYGNIAKVPLGTGFSQQSKYNPGADDAYTRMIGGARANLGGYSDWAIQQSINNLRNQQALNQISNFAGGQSRNVFPLQMYSAQHSHDDMAAIGQAISSIGGAAGNYMQLYGQQPTTPGYSPQYVNAGGYGGPAAFSGYGGITNQPPLGTSYSPYTDQNTIRYGGGWIPGY